MNIELIEPTFTTCSLRLYNSDIPTERMYKTNWHMHQEIEMILLLTGTKAFYINNERILLQSGDIIFINGNIPHKTETPIGSSCVLLQFNASHENADEIDCFLRDNVNMDMNSTYFVFENGTEANSLLTDCIQKICRENSEKVKAYDFFIKAYLCEITALLYRNGILSDYADLKKRILPLTKVLEYVNRHYSEHISLSEISGILNFHSSYFCKYFKRIIGFSFIEYLNIVRLSKAKRLMRETEKNITEISFEVGFSSVSYFIKIFKRYNYCSPKKYRALIQ